MDNNKVVSDLNSIVDSISALEVGPPILWVVAWDIIKYCLNSEDYVRGTFTDEQIFDMLLGSAGQQGFTLGFTLEDGMDALFEHVEEWMIKNDIVLQEEEDESA